MDVAERVGCKVETVWTRLHYARQEFERIAEAGLSGSRGEWSMSDAPRRSPRLTEGRAPLGRLLAAVRDPPPPPGARDRVWRGLSSSSRRPRLAWLVGPALAGALVAVLAFFAVPAWLPAPAPRCTLSFAAGEVETGVPGSPWSAAEAGAKLPWGTRVQTAEDSRAFVRMAGSGALLSPSSQLVVREDRGRGELVLVRGAVAVVSDAQPPLVVAGSYSVRAADAVLGVRSTAEGVVVWVQQGSAEPGARPLDRRGLGPGPTGAGPRGRSTDPAPMAIPAPTSVAAPMGSPASVGARPAVSQRAGERPTASAAPGARAPTEDADAAPPAGDALERLQARLRGAAPDERDDLVYELASLLAQRGRYGEAVAFYESLAEGRGTRAELSLYEVGRLRRRHLGDPQGAERAFTVYRRRFTSGLLAQETLLALIELQLDASRLEDALHDLDAFLAAWPAALADFLALDAAPGVVGGGWVVPVDPSVGKGTGTMAGSGGSPRAASRTSTGVVMDRTVGRIIDPLQFPLQPCGMRPGTPARSSSGGRRRYPRFFLDVDWFVESHGCSAMGRGLEVSVRGAMLPVTCRSPFTPEVTLFVSLPARQAMFKAHCSALQRAPGGWVLTFQEVAPQDLQPWGLDLMCASEAGSPQMSTEVV